MREFNLYTSPYGDIGLDTSGGVLQRSVLFREDCGNRSSWKGVPACGPFRRQLDAYFNAWRTILLPPRILALDKCSPFEKIVYLELISTEFGEITSYGELARRCGAPRAARAVGNALAANPFPIFVPCHRVVLACGGKGGFSAGLRWKSMLLKHESQAGSGMQ